MIMMYGVIIYIMIEYGDERMIVQIIDGEQNQQIMTKDNDHVLHDGMYQVHENGDY